MRRMQFAVAGVCALISAVVGQSLEPTFQTDLMVASELESTDENLGDELSSDPIANPESVAATDTRSQTNLPFDIRWLMIVPAFVLGMLTHMMARHFWPSKRSVAPARPSKQVAVESRNGTQAAQVDSGKGMLALVARERKKSQQLTEDLAEVQRELRKAKSDIRDLEKKLSSPSQPAPVDQMDDEVGFHSVDQPR